MFWPDHYVKEGHSLKLADNHLSQDYLRKMAKRVTKFRKHLLKNAKLAAESVSSTDVEAYQKDIDKLAKRMHEHFERPTEASKENIWSSKKKSKFQKWQSFSLDDKIKVIHEVVIGKAKMADVAKKYHRT